MSFDAIETTAIVLFILAADSILAWVLSTTRITEHFAERILSFTTQSALILMLIDLITLIVGRFLETIAAITILVPVFLPITDKLGVPALTLWLPTLAYR